MAAWDNDTFVIKLNFSNVRCMLFQVADHVVVQGNRCSHLNFWWMCHVPNSSNIVFIGARNNPITIRCPRYATNHFYMFFNFINEFTFISNLPWWLIMRLDDIWFIRTSMRLKRPNKDLSFLTYGGEFITLIIELT